MTSPGRTGHRSGSRPPGDCKVRYTNHPSRPQIQREDSGPPGASTVRDVGDSGYQPDPTRPYPRDCHRQDRRPVKGAESDVKVDASLAPHM